MRPASLSLLCIVALIGPCVAETLPIDSSFWKSSQFRRAFTASYGVNARIEPRIWTDEQAVLSSVADAMEDGNRQTAINRLTGSSLTKTSAPLSITLGNLQFEAGESDQAIDAFEIAVDLYPNFRDAHRNLAVALVQEGRFEEAEEPLIRAVELGAQDGLTFGLLGYVHLNHDRYQAALQAYRMAQITMPRETQWKFGEAQCLLALDSIPEAAALYRELLERAPTSRALWLNQADAFIQLGQPVDAIANLEMAHRMDLLTPAEVLTLGHLYLNEDLSEQALKVYLAAIQTSPPAKVVKALDALDNLTRGGRWDEAETFLTAFEEVYEPQESAPEFTSYQRSKALLALQRGNTAQGVELVQAILKRNPLDGQALLMMARHHSDEGDREQALMLAEQAAQAQETTFDALLLQGELLIGKADYEKAAEILAQALDLQPSAPLAEYLETV